MPPGLEGVKRLIGMYRSAFPDIRFETGEMIGEGDTVAHRWTFTGTHRGALMGVEPTGRRVEVAGVARLPALEREKFPGFSRRGRR